MLRRDFLGSSLAALTLPLLSPLARAQDFAGRKPLLLGQSVDLSGVMQNIGREYFSGAKLAFDLANQSGGVGGRSIQLVQMDDGGDPARAVANATQLIESERVELLFGFSSESCVEAVSKCAAFRRSELSLFAPLSGIDHPGAQGRVVYLRPSAAEEMLYITRRLTQMSLTRLGLIHTQAPSMLAARDAALKGLGDLNIGKPRTYSLHNGAANAPALIEAIARDNLQGVVVMADAFSVGLLAQKLRAANPALFICLGSMVDVSTVYQLVGPQLAHGLMVARVAPDPANTLIPVVADYTRGLRKYMEEAPSSAGLEGFIAARVLLDMLRRGGNLRHLGSDARRYAGVMDVGGWKLNLASQRAIDKVGIAMLTREGRLI